jgi:predicted nucleotidyltransferase component of viral defense system
MGLEVLADIQKEILNYLSDIPELEAFYLTGGTALSRFYLGHRKSNDLDFFTSEEELIQPFSLKIEEVLKKARFDVERKRGFRSFIELAVSVHSESTIIHLALDSPYRLDSTTVAEEFPGIRIDSLEDIAANKLLALFGRATLRDFVDVFFLVREKFEKNELILMAKKKDPGFDLYWLATAFERVREFSADSPEMLLLLKPCPIEVLSAFFDVWRGEIFLEITKK